MADEQSTDFAFWGNYSGNTSCGVQTRNPRKGKTVLSASSGEVAFYEATFPAGLRRLGIPSNDSSRGRGRTSSEVMGHPSKKCNKVLILSSTEEERFRQVFEKIEEGHFKIPVILNLETFYKYFTPGRVKVSSSDGGMARSEIRGGAEGDIKGESVAIADHATMSRRLKLSELAKVMAQKAIALALKGVAKKTKTGSGVHEVPARPPTILREGRSARQTLGQALGPQALVIASTATAEKILARVILLDDKEKVEKLTFDQVVTKFLHVLGVILGSSLAVRSRDFAKHALNQRALVESSKMEMVQAQNRAIELERALAKEKTKGKKAAEEIEARNEVVAKLEARVAELEKSQNLAKGRIIAAFKESDNFLEAVRGSTSSYFGDGFDFYTRQLAHQYPNLGLDLEDIEMDHDLLAKRRLRPRRERPRMKVQPKRKRLERSPPRQQVREL
ncbi:hypothetical protein Acr_02g0014610 [Actinidia rufa]|uniref:Uncharacterized protein n=1 Tax=Actinidia rufa TaxID=165716 RepID=A0A7J0E9P4_9ERIC|nr:hypothetical protein Acr_02g0014610 [Actinidia rufa]